MSMLCRISNFSRRCIIWRSQLIQSSNKYRTVKINVTEHTIHNKKVGLIGLPFHRGQGKDGVAMAPQQLRDHGLVDRLALAGCNVYDHGDMEFDALTEDEDPPQFHIKFPITNGLMARKVSRKVQSVIENGEIAVNIGGDHAVGIGTIHGCLQAKPDSIVIWVDAHTDINPPLVSPSGNIHGMSMAFLCYQLQQYMIKLNGFDWFQPCLSVKDIVYIGVRDIDPAERYLLRQFNIKAYTPDDIDQHGLDYILEHAMHSMNPGMRRPIHLSFDVDSLDPKYMPCTGTPAKGGLKMHEALYLCEELASTGQLSSIDLVEINTEVTENQEDKLKTLSNAIDILTACVASPQRSPDANLSKKT